MKKFISFLRFQLISFNAYWHKKRKLNELRFSNPSCKIDSANLRDVDIGQAVVIHEGARLNCVQIGDYSYVSKNTNLENVDIGKYCSVGPQVQIGLATHPTRGYVSSYPGFYSDQNASCVHTFTNKKTFDDSVPETTIGSDVWIGANVIIPGGIKIGDGAIIAAGAVVAKDVPAYAIVGGNPAKEIRKRFTNEQIELLLRVKWWDWPANIIEEQAGHFADIGKFIEYHNIRKSQDK